jgi:hypothetical protein
MKPNPKHREQDLKYKKTMVVIVRTMTMMIIMTMMIAMMIII